MAVLGGYGDNDYVGAAWVFTRSNGTWTQQGSKLVGTGAVGAPEQGYSASLSSDGKTAIVGGYFDSLATGAAWVYSVGTSGILEPMSVGPLQFNLEQNYPNPFNPATNIQFSIVNRQWTILKVFDVLGRAVATLVNEVKQPGTYTVKFDGSNLSSGVYLYHIHAEGNVITRKMVLMK
jgi:hypothetical protein